MTVLIKVLASLRIIPHAFLSTEPDSAARGPGGLIPWRGILFFTPNRAGTCVPWGKPLLFCEPQFPFLSNTVDDEQWSTNAFVPRDQREMSEAGSWLDEA